MLPSKCIEIFTKKITIHPVNMVMVKCDHYPAINRNINIKIYNRPMYNCVAKTPIPHKHLKTQKFFAKNQNKQQLFRFSFSANTIQN